MGVIPGGVCGQPGTGMVTGFFDVLRPRRVLSRACVAGLFDGEECCFKLHGRGRDGHVRGFDFHHRFRGEVDIRGLDLDVFGSDRIAHVVDSDLNGQAFLLTT